MSDSELKTEDIRVDSKTISPNKILDEGVVLPGDFHEIWDFRGAGVSVTSPADGEVEIDIPGVAPSGGLKGGMNWPTAQTSIPQYYAQQSQAIFQIFTVFVNQIGYVPIVINEDITIDRITGRAQTGGSFPWNTMSPQARINLAIYSSVGELPGLKLVESGYFPINTANFNRLVTPTLLTRGVYWLTSVVNKTVDLMGVDFGLGGAKFGIRDIHVFNGNGGGLLDVALRYLEMLDNALDPLPGVAGTVNGFTFDAAGLPIYSLERQ